jgi:hypothetical protein
LGICIPSDQQVPASASVAKQAELGHDRLVGDTQQGRISDPMQNVCVPHRHGQYVAASKQLILVTIDRGMHSPGDNRVDVVRGVMQLFGYAARGQPDRVQPGRRHRVLGLSPTGGATQTITDKL